MCSIKTLSSSFSSVKKQLLFLVHYLYYHFVSRAHSLDPQDPQIALYLSLQLALVRQVKAQNVDIQWLHNLQEVMLSMNVCLLGLSGHGATADRSVSARGRLALAPSADPAAQRTEAPPSRTGHCRLGPQPAPGQLKVKPTTQSHSHTNTTGSVRDLVPPQRLTTYSH